MNDFLEKNKQYIIGGVVLLAVVGIFIYWKNSSSNGPDFTSSDASVSAEQLGIGQDILVTLESMRRVRIDTSVYKDPAFQSLVDHSMATTSESVSRPDPFAPYDSSSTLTDTSSKI